MEHTLMRTLVKTDNIWIQRCDCGLFHVHVGALTLRFEEEAFEMFLSSLGEAMSRDVMWRNVRSGKPVAGIA